MKRKTFKRNVLAGMLGCLLVYGLWAGLEAGKATTESLGGKERLLTHLSTDKPIYKPGETIYVRGVLLDAFTHKPLAEDPKKLWQRPNAKIEIKGPKGDTVASGWIQAQHSVLGYSWKIPDGQAGGEYTIKVAYPRYGHTPAERKFDVRLYRAPRLKSQITFVRDGYGPGDRVGATLEVKRAEGGVPEGAKVTVIGRVDGQEVHRGPAKVSAKGVCEARFKLPDQIARGEGTLAFVIEDGGIVETATKTIPILLQTVDLKMYPEGGDLIAGLPNRVYFEARTPAKKPADIAGIIVDGEGRKVSEFRSAHEGRGHFLFKPSKDATYKLRINEPSGIRTTYALPNVKPTGVVIYTPDRISPPGKPVRVAVACAGTKKVKITLSHREVELDAVEVDYETDRSKGADRHYAWKTLNAKGAEGVLVVTVWDEKGTPLAERLTFRRPAKQINVSITCDKKAPVPGDKVKLTVKTTDNEGKPIASVVGLTVTDDSVLEMIEKREQTPRLPVMVFLENDVMDLADAHVYLNPKDPKASLATDLLLGTQGWRRFAFVDATRFLGEHGDHARRALALKLRSNRFNTKKGRGLPVPVLAAVERAEPLMDRDPGKKPAGPPPVPQAKKPVAKQQQAGKHAVAAAKPVKAKEEHARNAMRRALRKADAKRERKAIAGEMEEMELKRRRRQDFVFVREFAHKLRPNRKPNDRVDFAETLYWNAGFKTDATTGEATVAFALSDAVTAFRVHADAFNANGALGHGTTTVESVEPFYIEPKLPLEVTAGDVIELPIGVVNGIGSDLLGARLTAETARGLRITDITPFDLAAMQRARRIMQIKVGHLNKTTDFVLQATAGAYSDKVTRKLRVVPLGFPVEIGNGGMLGPKAAASHTITIPAQVVPRSIKTTAAVYPTPLANLTQALERLIREPYGCFEQTSSTTYPLIMAQQYFLSHTGVDPQLVERSRALLDKGYKRLIGFECKKRGYEWFAGDPGHEALTAYGLLEFTDMAQVRQVDQQMLARTKAWMLKARDGRGGFTRKRRALHTWITDRNCSNGYILWAMLESGESPKNLSEEIPSFKQESAKSKNSYVLALGANALHMGEEKEAAKALMARLAKLQTKDGWVDGATTSIVGSGGEALKIETTSLATLAWLREPAYAGNVEKAIKYLADCCKGGRYGSTQSTVLALRAIVTYDKARAKPKAPGRVRIHVDGQPVGDYVNFDQSTHGAIKLPDISELLTPGEHKVELKMEGGGTMPYALSVDFHNKQPDASKACKVALEVKLNNAEMKEGGITEAAVNVTNLQKESIPTPVAIIGLPGGLEPRHDQLKELVKKEKIAAYEVRGREVVLYWRSLKAEQKVELPISLVAAVPGTYTGPASRAYLYYTDEHKNWIDPLKVTIRPVAR